jgi:hypothetical protein
MSAMLRLSLWKTSVGKPGGNRLRILYYPRSRTSLSLSHLLHDLSRRKMLFLLAFLYLQCFRPALTAPLPNVTALNTEVAPPWVDDPSGRGTWNLLYSCGFTLVLCVWTSIHLNVPPPHESAWLAWRRKMKWVVVALIAPEAVVFTAFQQWLTATCFLK